MPVYPNYYITILGIWSEGPKAQRSERSRMICSRNKKSPIGVRGWRDKAGLDSIVSGEAMNVYK